MLSWRCPRKSLYVDIYNTWTSELQYRHVSTRSAINRGLRASKDEPRRADRDRSARSFEPEHPKSFHSERTNVDFKRGQKNVDGRSRNTGRRQEWGISGASPPRRTWTMRRGTTDDRPSKDGWGSGLNTKDDRPPKARWASTRNTTEDRTPKARWESGRNAAEDDRPKRTWTPRPDAAEGRGYQNRERRIDGRPTTSNEARTGRNTPDRSFDGRQRGATVDPHRQQDDSIPVSIPYTTAASTFIYGTNAVLAALRGKRRQIHRVYLNQRVVPKRDSGGTILKLAERFGIDVRRNVDPRLLDKMSDNRPHNGVVLEASRLATPPALSLAKPVPGSGEIPLVLDRQSAEDAAVNGAPASIPCPESSWRQPFVVLLDGIVDPGNLGNILRSAHFFGVDAVAVATGTCANLSSAVLAKASSGACEAIRLLAVPKPAQFVFDSGKAGWDVYAAVAPQNGGSKQAMLSTIASSSPLAKRPCLLMLGAEGEGLRENLVNKADHLLSIERAKREQGALDVGVDSLNVGVAAGVLMDAFMRKPVGSGQKSLGF